MDDADGSIRFSFGPEDPSLADRLDALVDDMILLPMSAMAADYTVVRTGGSLTGFMVGDPVPDGGLSHDPLPLEVDPFGGA